MSEGLLDTNVFIHAYMLDQHSEECRRFLAAVARGEVQAWLEVLVVHELTYAFPRVIKQFTRESLADLLLNLINWPGILCREKEVLVETLTRWKSSTGLSFVDAYLAASAGRSDMPVYTKNMRELVAQGVEVPVPLPA